LEVRAKGRGLLSAPPAELEQQPLKGYCDVVELLTQVALKRFDAQGWASERSICFAIGSQQPQSSDEARVQFEHWWDCSHLPL
jgi:hypothetical protein